MTSSFGERFRITTFGESHGTGVGVVVDGCPPGIAVSREDIQEFLDRRRPGQSALTTSRGEKDEVEILSGLHDGQTLGSPIALMVRNKDARSGDYGELETVYRPSHADFTTEAKYGNRAAAGGGRSSARETIGRVAAAAIARAAVRSVIGPVDVVGWVERVAEITSEVNPETVSLAEVEAHATRCPDPQAHAAMESLILGIKKQGDTVGGTVAAVARGLPPGLGEPIFDKFEASLAAAMMSLPASKSFEIGSGIGGTYLRGSEHNDAFCIEAGQVRTTSNRSGGVQGGITNGMPVFIRVGFKPVSTIFSPQQSVTSGGEETEFRLKKGRHDPCVLPRAVPMVEAMVWICIADHMLRQRALTGRLTDGRPKVS